MRSYRLSCRYPVSRSDLFHRTNAFTLIEVLVVVAIIALLIAILLPSLARVRDQALEAKCATQESQFGRGFFAYAADNQGYLCSGAYDPEMVKKPNPIVVLDSIDNRDGPVDRVGWIADLVNSRTAKPTEMLCPTNEAKVNQKIGQGTHGWALHMQGLWAYPNSRGGIAFVDDYRTWELIDDRINRGYNSNYAQTWYMARTEMKGETSLLNAKRVPHTKGPLRLSAMNKVAPAWVPILGDGNIDYDTKYRGRLELGTLTVRTMTDGPVTGLYGPQLFEDIGPAHGRGKKWYKDDTGQYQKCTPRTRANVLFADGHVSQFLDKVRDGIFDLKTMDVDDPDYGTVVEYQQEDVDSRVFDGVLSLGRRTHDRESYMRLR